MEKLSPTAFEALHIISVGLTKLEKIFKKHKINSENLYILLFIDIIGKDCEISGKTVKSVPQDYLRNSVKDVFGLSPATISRRQKKLRTDKMLGETTDFDINEMRCIFSGTGKRSKIVYLRSKGEIKINEIADALKIFKTELSSNLTYAKKLLKSPNLEDLGPVAQALLFLLQAY